MPLRAAAPMARPGEALLRAGITPVPPGTFFDERFLKPRGLSINQVADEMRLEPSYLQAFVENRGRVDWQFAHKLATFTGTTVGFWLNIQSATDLADGWQATAS